MRELTHVLAFFSFWLGACIASFLNVVIWRVPRGESIVRPPSHCPKCGASIKWWQNIPIISWLALRGRCAACRAPISPRYIFVETLGGCLFLTAFLRLWMPDAPTWVSAVHLLVMWTWIALMITGSFIDYDLQLLPDFVTIGGMVLGLTEAALFTGFNFAYGSGLAASAWGKLAPIMNSAAGLAFGFGLMWLVRWLGSKAFKREAMGMGDVLLMGAVGALFGPCAVLATIMLSSVLGSFVGIGMILVSKAKLGRFVAIPYGPYICLGCLAWIFFGAELVTWYVGLFK